MLSKRVIILNGFLITIAVLIRLFSANSAWVELYYSNGFYPAFSAILRTLFGWLPFSFGDILYGCFIIWVGWKLIKNGRALFKKQVTKQSFVRGFFKTISILLIFYILFNIFWGINYNRKGIASQLNLSMEKYSVDELKNINALLVQKINLSKFSLIGHDEKYPSSKELFKKVQLAYNRMDSRFSFLQYRSFSIKPSLWGWLGNYLGFTGYYNPFTGEAQVSTSVPPFIQPFVSCHEVAHQLGYAKEMEANFVGYLAASSSNDTLLHYSVYLDLFLYSNRNLYNSDSLAAKFYGKALLPEVKMDLKEWRAFNLRHKNPIEPVFRWLYGKYLQSNQQPQGVLSYDEVTGFIIAYYKKFGKI